MLKKYFLNFYDIYISNIIKKLKNENKKALGQIGILKFLFSIVVILSHFYKFKIDNFLQWKDRGALAVHCFFIISGFFFYNTIKKIDKISFEEFSFKKIFRLYPVFLFNIILYGKKFIKFTSNFFMLSIGIMKEYPTSIWYIGVLFYVLLFYFYLYKNYQRKNVNLIIVIIMYFSSMFLFNKKPKWFGTWQNDFIFFNSGFIRGLLFVGLGIFSHIFYEKISLFFNKRENKQSKLYFLIFSILEIIFFHKMIKYLFIKNKVNALNAGLDFCILLCLFVTKKGILSKILDNKISIKLGEYSYSIYVMHYICLKTLNKFSINGIPLRGFFSDTNFNIFLVLSCVLFGILVYYLVEKPSYKYLSDRFLNNEKKVLN